MISPLFKVVTVSLLVVLTGGCGVTASSRNPGYVGFDEGRYDGVHRDTSISIGPTLLKIAARYVDDDPHAKALLAALDGVRVQVYRLDGEADLAALVRHVDAAASSLDDRWERIVRVQEDDSTAHIMIKYSEEAILGLAILAVDEDELTFVNVMGELTPEMFKDLSPAVPEEQALALRYMPLN